MPLEPAGQGEQIAAVRRPSKHELFPDTSKPILHDGAHVEPEARLDVQVPLLPLAGGVLASHGAGVQGLNVFV